MNLVMIKYLFQLLNKTVFYKVNSNHYYILKYKNHLKYLIVNSI